VFCSVLQFDSLLQFVAMCCNVLQCVAVCCSVTSMLIRGCSFAGSNTCQYIINHPPVQHTATHCNTCTAHCNTLQHTATYCNILQHTATHCNTLQHMTTHQQSAPVRSHPLKTIDQTAKNKLKSEKVHKKKHKFKSRGLLISAAKQGNKLQNTATQCNTMQHNAKYIL